MVPKHIHFLELGCHSPLSPLLWHSGWWTYIEGYQRVSKVAKKKKSNSNAGLSGKCWNKMIDLMPKWDCLSFILNLHLGTCKFRHAQERVRVEQEWIRGGDETMIGKCDWMWPYSSLSPLPRVIAWGSECCLIYPIRASARKKWQSRPSPVCLLHGSKVQSRFGRRQVQKVRRGRSSWKPASLPVGKPYSLTGRCGS